MMSQLLVVFGLGSLLLMSQLLAVGLRFIALLLMMSQLLAVGLSAADVAAASCGT